MLRRPLKVIAGKHYVLNGDCWEWTGNRNNSGYALSGPGLWKLHRLAHRAVYIDAGNDLQPGIHLHHRCENKACVNPAHLEPSLGRLHLAHHRQEESPLTWDDIREIRQRAHGDVFPIELMNEFGISRQSIGQIILNQAWEDPNYEPPTLVRYCDLNGCGEPYTPVRAHQRFCTRDCRVKWNARRSYLLARQRTTNVAIDAPVRVYRKAA